ncbi:MAG: hypothetical protein JO261_05490 [Alphaproteobacteria bacterium]|nr:hypothetical protein [Alphaproteobacteria bacterium]MBV9693135.1 hypothetical protein [Alphaproteobacteria bacterium]
MNRASWRIRAFAIPICTLLPLACADAHGIVGDRFFPATIATDDPFAADELALPTVSVFRHKDDGAPVDESDADFEWSKSIAPGFAIAFGGGYVDAKPDGGPAATGFDNLEITPLLEIVRDADREFILTAGMSFEIGGSGSRAVADRFTTYTPEILFGKGFGDLPDSMALLKPFAVTGVLGYAIPGSGAAPHSLHWGGAVEYSLLYLQTDVRDEGLGPFMSHLTPVVEFDIDSPTGGALTGTIDPGLIWSGQYSQFGIEAMIPLNAATGRNVGVIAQLHFYLDDLFPHSIGRPLFAGAR